MPEDDCNDDSDEEPEEDMQQVDSSRQFAERFHDRVLPMIRPEVMADMLVQEQKLLCALENLTGGAENGPSKTFLETVCNIACNASDHVIHRIPLLHRQYGQCCPYKKNQQLKKK